jgi:hypothetical protein
MIMSFMVDAIPSFICSYTYCCSPVSVPQNDTLAQDLHNFSFPLLL